MPGLLTEGKLFRVRRALSRANELCSGSAQETWAVQVGVLAELGALAEARQLGEVILQAEGAPPEAGRAAKAALAEITKLSRDAGTTAREAAKKSYAEAATAFLRNDYNTAYDAAHKAWATYHPNPDALYLAAIAARARGESAVAQRLFDRARVEVVPKDKDAGCLLDRPCGGGVELLERSPGSGNDALLYSPASRLLAVGLLDYGVQILNTGGRTRSLLERASGGVVESTFAFMAFSPDGRRLLRQARTQQKHASAAEIYDVETGLLVRQLPNVGAGYGMGPLCLSPDGKRLGGVVVGKGERGYDLWVLDAESGRKLWSTKLRSWPSWIGYTGDGKIIASLHMYEGPHEVTLHDAVTGRTRTLSEGDRIEPSSPILAASPDGASFAGFFARRLRLLDVRTGKLTMSFDVQESDTVPVAFSPDGKRVLAVQSHGVVVADTATGKVTATFIPPEPGGASGAVFLDDQRIVVNGGGDVFWEWEVGAPGPHRTIGPSVARHARAAFSPVDDLIATGLRDGGVALWDPGSPTVVRRLPGHSGSVTALAFSPDGSALFSASRDGTVRRWDVLSGRLLNVLSGHTAPVSAIAVSPDGRSVASGSEDRTARLWHADAGTEVQKLLHPASVQTVAFSSDGKQLVTGAEDGVLRLFDAGFGTVLRTASAGDSVRMAFWTGDAEVFSWSGRGSNARFFQWALQGEPVERKGLSTSARVAAPSDDGLLLAVAGPSGVGKLLDLRAEKPLHEIRVSVAEIAGLALQNEGAWIAAATSHGLSLFRRGAQDPAITLSVTPGLTAVMAQTSDGYFDITGPDGDTLRRLSRCTVNSTYQPIELCEEQFRVPGLFAKVMAGDESFRDP